MNVCTLFEAGKSTQLTEMERNKLDIFGVCETHLTDSEKTTLRAGQIMLKSGRNKGMHMEGVALLLGRRVHKSLTGWEPHSSRILRASFLTNKRIKMNNVVIYARTNEAEDQENVD